MHPVRRVGEGNPRCTSTPSVVTPNNRLHRTALRAATKPERGAYEAGMSREERWQLSGNAAEFVPGHLAALPMAQEIARLSAERRNALVHEIPEALGAYVDRGQLIFSASVHVVTADA